MNIKSREKRHFIRFEREFGVNYLSVPKGHEISYGDMEKVRTMDASVSGIQLVSKDDSSMEVNDEVELEIKINDKNDFVDAFGTIRWKKKVGDEIHYGVEFTAVGEWDSYADVIDKNTEQREGD